jgi:hypothetical protein
MKLNLGASGIFQLLVVISLIVFFLLVPYPYYEPAESRWFLGASVGARLGGARENGVPLEKVFEKVTKATITNPLEITCSSNADCKNYVVPNQCRIYCGNTNEGNTRIQTILGNNRVCDPATWREPPTNCSCVYGNCVDLE